MLGVDLPALAIVGVKVAAPPASRVLQCPHTVGWFRSCNFILNNPEFGAM